MVQVDLDQGNRSNVMKLSQVLYRINSDRHHTKRRPGYVPQNPARGGDAPPCSQHAAGGVTPVRSA